MTYHKFFLKIFIYLFLKNVYIYFSALPLTPLAVTFNITWIVDQYTRQYTFAAAPSTPPHYPYNSNYRPDVLDIALLKTGNLNFQLTNFFAELSSDHSSIVLDLNFNVSHASLPKPSYVTDWIKFENILSSTFFPLLTLLSPITSNKKSQISFNFSPLQSLNVLLSFLRQILNRISLNTSSTKSP